jgi:hypothetical protein
MLHNKTLNEISNRATCTFEDRLTESVEIYRSIDKNITSHYFGDKNKPTYFEIAIFHYNHSKNQVYIKYPDTDFYVELYGGSGSSRGNMSHYSLRNILEEEIQPFVYEGVLQPKSMKLYKHENHLLVDLASTYGGDFNFLERVAYIKPHQFEKTQEFGYDVYNEFIKSKFIPLPDAKNIAYKFKTIDGNLIIVDQSAYNFTYESMRCFYGNLKDGIKEGKISGFERYRDGGTTNFDVTVNGKVHKFHSPSRLGKKDDDYKPTWDGNIMTETEISNEIISGLGIMIAPEVARK